MILIDYSLLLLMLLLVVLRKPQMRAFCDTFVQFFTAYQNELIAKQEKFDYMVSFDCRRIYFEHYLNNEHDFTLRRIFIRDVIQLPQAVIYQEIEGNEPFVVYQEGETPTIPEQPVYMENELSGVVDFEVVVPVGFIYDEQLMRSHIDMLRLPGKSYQIIEE